MRKKQVNIGFSYFLKKISERTNDQQNEKENVFLRANEQFFSTEERTAFVDNSTKIGWAKNSHIIYILKYIY